MDAAVTYSPSGSDVARWLEVLRPALAHRGEDLYEKWNREEREANPNVENFDLRSSLPQHQLRDLHMHVNLSVDHEGGGQVQFEYTHVPPQHRLQALLSIMGCLSD